MNRSVSAKVVCAGVLGLSASMLGGCLFGQSKSSTIEGNYVSAETLGSVRAGMPLADAVTLLGEPTSRGTLSDGSEICKWTYTRTDKGAGYAFLIFAGSDRTERALTTYVQARNGVIDRVWQDETKR